MDCKRKRRRLRGKSSEPKVSCGFSRPIRKLTSLAEQGASSGNPGIRGRADRRAGEGRIGPGIPRAGTGLYCTLIVRPKQPQQILAAPYARRLHCAGRRHKGACRSGNSLPFRLDVDIKWPNDVLLSGKKCAGILLEALWDDAENAAALVGFGINVHNGSVPADLCRGSHVPG